MPLLESSLDAGPWLSPLTPPEQVHHELDNMVPNQPEAYYLTPITQIGMDTNTVISQQISTAVALPTPGGGHEPLLMAESLPYLPSIVLDSSAPSESSRSVLNFLEIPQPTALNHSISMKIPGAHGQTWPAALQETPILTCLNPTAEGRSISSQHTAGTEAYAGPRNLSAAQSLNGFPFTIPGHGIQQIHNSQFMGEPSLPHGNQSTSDPLYITALAPLASDYSGLIQASYTPISNPNPNTGLQQVFQSQPSQEHNTILWRQQPPGFKAGQNIAETGEVGAPPTGGHVPVVTKPVTDYGYAEGHARKGVAEDCLSDLGILTQSWLKSHIASFEDVLKHIPLDELGKQAMIIDELALAPQGKSSSWNLVKIENIPYNLDDDMMFEFLGKAPGLVPEEYGGIHIIMDRTTGKTMDCFLEFPTVGAAERFIQRRCNNNRRCILGGRHISLELVRQGEMMRWLFPKIRGAIWGDDGDLVPNDWMGSKMLVEIISREELVMILGHARTPHRSPFSRKCLQRPYESLMSVVTKFPWKETDFYTLKQRDLIFQAAFEAGELLKRQILRGKAGPNIDLKLLRRLCRTISFCPGFTYRQKLTFLDAMGITTTECFAILGDLGISHPLATQFQALTVRPGAEYVAVEAIANLVADGVSRGNSRCKEANLNTRTGIVEATDEDACHGLTMRAAAAIELENVYTAIRAIFE